MGGYSKKEALAKTEAYNRLLSSIDDMKLSDAAINAELEKIRRMPLPRAKCLFIPIKGLSVTETDEYIAKLEEEIKRKIML